MLGGRGQNTIAAPNLLCLDRDLRAARDPASPDVAPDPELEPEPEPTLDLDHDVTLIVNLTLMPTGTLPNTLMLGHCRTGPLSVLASLAVMPSNHAVALQLHIPNTRCWLSAGFLDAVLRNETLAADLAGRLIGRAPPPGVLAVAQVLRPSPTP